MTNQRRGKYDETDWQVIMRKEGKECYKREKKWEVWVVELKGSWFRYYVRCIMLDYRQS